MVGYDVLDPNYCLGSVPYVDGLCIEHFGSFEQVTTAEGRSNPDWFLTWINVTNRVMDGDYGDDKSIFIKAWPGPVGSPIDAYGPTWPSAYEGYPRPSTYAELQVVSKELITFPLAIYLCGIYREGTYFSYAWWYGWYHGYIPCPDDLDSCTAPVDWYEEFTNKLGEPLGDRIMKDTYKCSRSFENANVYVDLRDITSANITWFTDSPTMEPTNNPSMEPTGNTGSPTSEPESSQSDGAMMHDGFIFMSSLVFMVIFLQLRG